MLLQCAEQSDGEDNMSDSEIPANVTVPALTGSHELTTRSAESVSKVVSRSDTDSALRTAVGTTAQLSSSTAQSPYQHQRKADESRKKSAQRVRSTRCHKCVNCLATDCSKCHSCRSVHIYTFWPSRVDFDSIWSKTYSFYGVIAESELLFDLFGKFHNSSCYICHVLLCISSLSPTPNAP